MKRQEASVITILGAVLVSFLFLVSAAPPIERNTTLSPAISLQPVTSAAVPPPSTHPIQHVVVIFLENEGSPAVNKYGTYERYLGSTFGNDTWMYSACHGSPSNYLAAAAAVTNQCPSGVWTNYTNTSVADLISEDRSNSFTWAQFAEGLPSNICVTPNQNQGEFVFRHVPFLYFRNVTENQTFCRSHVLDSAYFNGTSGAEGITSPHFVNLSFYAPNMCDTGHSNCGSTVPSKCASLTGSSRTECRDVFQADSWLKGFLGSMLNSTNRVEENNVNHTMFIVTWDEDGNPTTTEGYAVAGITGGENYDYCYLRGNTPGYAVCGGHVYGLVVDHYNRGIAPMYHKDSPYGIAATIEWIFNLQGKHGTGLDNPGEYDYLYRTSLPGFPTLVSISGITSDGYAAGV